jgi:competence protein ComEC
MDMGHFFKTIASNLLTERDRWFLWVPVFFASGIGFYFLINTVLWFSWSLGITVVLGLLLAIVRHRSENMFHHLIITAFFCLVAGYTYVQGYTQLLATPILSKEMTARTMMGKIERIERRPGNTRITLDEVDIQTWRKDKDLTLPKKVRITFRGKLQPAKDAAVGDQVKLKAVLMPPSGPAAPGAYNFRRKAYYEGIGAVGYGITQPEIIDKGGWQWLVPIRSDINEMLRYQIPGVEGAIGAALVTGDRSGIPDELRQEFADAGIAHILAISGLHLTIIAGFVFFLMRRGMCCVPQIALRYDTKKAAAIGSIIFTTFYLALCWGAIPALRAYIMTILIMLAVLLERSPFSMRNVAIAAMIVMMVSPEAVIGPSFQLSFAAVIGLIAAYERGQNWFKKFAWRDRWWYRPAVYVLGVMITTIIATLATTPFSLYTFNRFPIHGMWGNLTGIPLASFWVMPALFLYLILQPFHLDGFILPVLTKGLALMVETAQTIAHWPNAVIHVPDMGVLAVLFITAGGLWLCLWRRRWRFYGLGSAVIGLVVAFFHPRPDVWVEQQGRLVGLQMDDGTFYVTSKRAGKFAHDMWLQKAGIKNSRNLKDASPYVVHCKDETCTYEKNGTRLTFSAHHKFWTPPKCGDITINLAKEPVKCEQGIVISSKELSENGSYAIWLDKGKIELSSAGETDKGRPWY